MAKISRVTAAIVTAALFASLLTSCTESLVVGSQTADGGYTDMSDMVYVSDIPSDVTADASGKTPVFESETGSDMTDASDKESDQSVSSHIPVSSAPSEQVSSESASSVPETSSRPSSEVSSEKPASSAPTVSGNTSSKPQTSSPSSQRPSEKPSAPSDEASSETSSAVVSDSFVPGAGVDKVYIDKDTPISADEYYWRGTLNSAEVKIYDEIAEASAALETVIELSTPAKNATVEKIMSLFRLDHPENFWWSNRYTVYQTGGNVVKIEMSLLFGTGEITKMQGEIDKVISKILAKLPARTTDFEAELFFHDWLVKNVDYTYAADGDDPEHNLYGALVKGESVCEGYAESLQYLCQRVGIPTMGISGRADNGSGVQNHKWNGIKIGGKWYVVDPTWDDPTGTSSPVNTGRHTYFNVSTADLGGNYVPNELVASDLPAFTSTAASFYVYYGIDCNTADLDKQFKRAMTYFADNAEGDIFALELRGVDDDTAQDCEDLLIDDGRIWTLVEEYNRENGTSYEFSGTYFPVDCRVLRMVMNK